MTTLNRKQAQAIADALHESGAANEFNINCGLVEALCDTNNFSEWRLNFGKLFINWENIWVSGPHHPWKEAATIARNANRLLAEAVRNQAINLHVNPAHYRNTVPLTADMAAEAWNIIATAAPLDDKRKAKFLQAVTSQTDTSIYVPTRNRQAALHFSNETYGLFLRSQQVNLFRSGCRNAESALRDLFKRHCALHNL